MFLKKYLYIKLCLSFMFLIVLLSLTTIQGHAASNNGVAVETITGHGYHGTGPTGGHAHDYFERWDTNFQKLYYDNEVVFCIEPWRITDHGIVYTKEQLDMFIQEKDLQSKLSWISYYGWHTSNQTNEDYVSTQLMIWEARGWSFSKVPSYYAQKKKIMQEKINRVNILPSFHNMKYEVYNQKPLRLTDTNHVLANFMLANDWKENITYTLENMTFSWHDNILTITPNTTHNTIQFSAANIPQSFHGSNIVYVNGLHQKVSPLTKVHSYQTLSFQVEVKQDSTVHLRKTNSLNQELAGAIFKIGYLEDLSDAKTYTTNADGLIAINHLQAGMIYYQEIQAPHGYLIDHTIYSTLLKAGEINEISMENEAPLAMIEVLKEDKDFHTPIAHVVFEVYDLHHTLMDTITTNEFGIAQTKRLPLGTYFLKEIQVPDMYHLDTTLHKIDIPYQNQETPIVLNKIKITNELKKGSILIYKIDAQTKLTIAGVEFTLYSDQAEKEKIGTFISDANGMITIENLRFSTYYLKESKPLSGYLNHGSTLKIIIDENSYHTPHIYNIENSKIPKTSISKNNYVYLFVGSILLLICLGLYKKRAY